LVFHSDRGVQYASKKFTNVIDSYKMITSMSRKGNCWDNAVAESFKTLKTEQIYGNTLYQKSKWNSIYSNLLKSGTTEKKAFRFRLQNNRRILETENNFKNVA
jgi:transposase InsO family protein